MNTEISNDPAFDSDSDRCVHGRYACTSDPDDTDTCRLCPRGYRKSRLAQGYVDPFYVVAYSVARLYGGAEEGGWWYDALAVEEVRKVYTFRSALYMARELRGAYPPPRFGRFSAAGGDDQYIKLCYSEADFPLESVGRPRYE